MLLGLLLEKRFFPGCKPLAYTALVGQETPLAKPRVYIILAFRKTARNQAYAFQRKQ